MPIKPATVTSLDKDAEMQTTIEGLPKGLKFDGRTITGTPVVEDDNWDGDNGMFKTVTLKFKAKKNGVMLVRKYKYWIYRDKDRDGIADDDEDGGTAFTPQRHNSKPLVVDGKEPTLDDYKALFSNIPADGSVKMSIKQNPDLSKKGTARAVLEFSVDGVAGMISSICYRRRKRIFLCQTDSGSNWADCNYLLVFRNRTWSCYPCYRM